MTHRAPLARTALALAAAALLLAPACSRQKGGSAAFEKNPSAARAEGKGAAPGGPGVAFASLRFEEALSKARSEKTLVMVDVYTDWCGWCKKLEKDVFADARVATALGNVVPIRVNAENGGEDVARRYGVEGFPTILFVDGNGKIVKRVDGYVPVDRMLEMIAALPQATA